jgi:hypothetical protein
VDSLIGTRKLPGFKTPIGRTRKVGPEFNNWYWNPFRAGAVEAPAYFRRQLREVDPDNLIDIRWNPIREQWGVFYRKPSMSHPICSGWVLLFMVGPRDLDETVLARLYSASAAKWGSGQRYFASVQREIEREEEAKEKLRRQEAVDLAMPFWDHSRISTAGKGNKFSEYHS